MCTRLLVATATVFAALAAAAPAAAYEFSREGFLVSHGSHVADVPHGWHVPGLAMTPHSGQTIAQLCEWAHGGASAPYVLDCTHRQFAANPGVNMNVIVPGEWYCVWLTPAELWNVLDVQQHDSGESYRLDQVERDVDTLEDRVDALEERTNANERAIRDEATARRTADEEHRARHDALDRRLGELGESTNPPSVPSAEPVWNMLDAWARWIVQWWLLIIVVLLIVLVALGFRRFLDRFVSRRQPATPTPQPAPPAPQQVQPQEQVVRIIVDASPQPASPPSAEPVPVPAVQPTNAPQPPSPPPSGGFTVEVVDKQKRTHTIRFAEASPDAKGRERGISPWTGNEILRARAALHAQEYIDKEGKPKPRSN